MARRVSSTLVAAAIAVALNVHTAQAGATPIVVPPLPDTLQLPAGNHPFLLGRAVGTQNYVCLPSGIDASGNPVFAWKLFTPEAGA